MCDPVKFIPNRFDKWIVGAGILRSIPYTKEDIDDYLKEHDPIYFVSWAADEIKHKWCIIPIDRTSFCNSCHFRVL
jgi:hypothetical protein